MDLASHNVLIVAPFWIGDMVMAHSLFKTLRQQHPEMNLDVLAPQWNSALLDRMPEVNRCISSPFQHGQWNWKQQCDMARKLRKMGYDQAIILRNSWKSALLPYLSRIPKRTGWVGEQRWGLLNDIRRLDKSRYPSMSERFVALAYPPNTPLPPQSHLLRPKLIVLAKEARTTAEKKQLDLSQSILALCPGAEFGQAKRWPGAYFAQVANDHIDRNGYVWLLGSSKECAIGEEIQKKTQHRCCNLIGQTTLSEAVDLLSLVHLAVTNDSGLMHIIAALDVPQYTIFGPTTPQFAPPLSPKAQILYLNLSCSPCRQRECPLGHHRCMNELSPTHLIDDLNRLNTT